MDVTDRDHWLRTQTALREWPEAAVTAIAAAIQPTLVQANRRVGLEETPPEALYILKSGELEQYRTSANGPATVVNLAPGALCYLQELLLDQVAATTLVTLTECELWVVPRAEFTAIAAQYPAIGQGITRQLAAALDEVSAQLAYEHDRQTALRPYLVTKARRGIVGNSRYAKRLRQEIKTAAAQAAATEPPQRVLIFGEPGLGKDIIAALIHFGSTRRRQPMIKLNCETLQASGAELFGRVGGKPGLLEWVGTGTVLLNNVQELPAELRPKILALLETGRYLPVARSSEAPTTTRSCQAQILMTSERVLSDFDCRSRVTQTIKVPPLRVRKADIAAAAQYFLSLICRTKGMAQPQITPEALRRLQSYDFPGNAAELEALIERAVIQAGNAPELTTEVFWATSPKGQRFRFNLLNGYPRLRQFLRSDWWPDRLNYGFVAPSFAIVVALLFLGPQTRDANIGLNLFWAWWWPVMLLVFPFLGRIWCAVCPFMIYGEIVQKLSLKWWPRDLLPWPRRAGDRVGGWFLVGLFALIFLWEELWNLENTAYLSACLLLLITAGAVTFSLLFERRFWCRYLCPIGGMNGLYAKLSMIELRAQQGICSATCTTYQCYKGGPAKGEGQATLGCPIYSHPAQLVDNRDCVLCMTCLQACPHRSVELNLRPPGIELWTTHQATAAEVSLLFLLLGGVFLHRLPELEVLLQHNLHLDRISWHALFSVLVLGVPIAIAAIAHRLMQSLQRQSPLPAFMELAYGYLPLVWGGTLAHYLHLGLTEAGRVIPVTLATFGLAGSTMPIAVANPAVITFLQASTLIMAIGLSLTLTHKIARQSLQFLWPQDLAIGAIGILLWQVIL